MPSGFIPNGMVANHSSPGSLSVQYCGDAMKASILPWDAASKHLNGCMIWPPGKTSIRNRPPVVSSTIFPSLWAAPCSTSRDGVQAVDIRHWIFGCAITLGASIATAAAAVASAPVAVTMNLRRSLVTPSSLPRHELVVGTFGDAIPGTDQGLELREGRVHLARHGRLLGFFLDSLGRELLELTQHGHRDLDHFDLALELSLEPFERDRVLRVESREAIDFARRRRVVQRPLQVHRQRVVCLLVETEVIGGPRLVPARVVVVPRGLVQAEHHVVVRAHPFAGVDDASLERRIDISGGNEDHCAARSRIDLSTERADAHPEALVVADGVHPLSEPSGHLRRLRARRARYEVEGTVRLLHQLEAVTLVEPCRHAFGVHAERNRVEPLDRRLLLCPVEWGGHESLDGAF